MTLQAESFIGSDGQARRVFRKDKSDESPIWKHWEPGNYDRRCACCWSGFSHSAAEHRAAIATAE